MLGEEKVFLSTFHRCFRRNFNPVYFQMVSGGPDSHTQQLVKGPVIKSIFNHRVEQVIHVGVRSFPEKGFQIQRSLFPLTQTMEVDSRDNYIFGTHVYQYSSLVRNGDVWSQLIKDTLKKIEPILLILSSQEIFKPIPCIVQLHLFV